MEWGRGKKKTKVMYDKYPTRSTANSWTSLPLFLNFLSCPLRELNTINIITPTPETTKKPIFPPPPPPFLQGKSIADHPKLPSAVSGIDIL